MSAPRVQTIALSRVALVHRTSDGAEQDRADGRELAALLSGIRPADRASLFEVGEIATVVRSLAEILSAVSEHDDTPPHVTSALYLVEMELRALVPRIERFEHPDQMPADFYAVEIAPEVTP